MWKTVNHYSVVHAMGVFRFVLRVQTPKINALLLLKTKNVYVSIDIKSEESYGRTNCDMFDYLKKPHNCDVAYDIDVEKFWDIIEPGIKNYA